MSDEPPRRPRRIVVVGGPGSGKTTLARTLASRLSVEHVELDGLWWERGWRHVSADELQARVRARLDLTPSPSSASSSSSGWVADGNYLDEVARSLLWPAADTIVWLDLPRSVAMRRALARTARRVAGRAPLWNDNRETWRSLTPANLRRVWRAWPDYGRRIAALLDDLGLAGVDVVRLRTAGDVAAWLAAQRPDEAAAAAAADEASHRGHESE